MFSFDLEIRGGFPGEVVSTLSPEGRVGVFQAQKQRKRVSKCKGPGLVHSPQGVPTLPAHRVIQAKSTLGCVASGKLLALSELQLPPLAGGLIILTSQDYASI